MNSIVTPEQQAWIDQYNAQIRQNRPSRRGSFKDAAERFRNSRPSAAELNADPSAYGISPEEQAARLAYQQAMVNATTGNPTLDAWLASGSTDARNAGLIQPNIPPPANTGGTGGSAGGSAGGGGLPVPPPADSGSGGGAGGSPGLPTPGNPGSPNLPYIPPPVSVGGEPRDPRLPITPGNPGPIRPGFPGMPGGDYGQSNTLASYGLLGGPNGEILPVMLNQGASPFQQMRQTPQIMGFDPSIPQGVQQMPQFRYQQGLPDYDWYTPPPPPEPPPAPPGNADGVPGNNSGGNTGGGTAPPMGPGSGYYRDNINPRQQIKAGLLGGPADASMGLLGNPYGAALPPALMGLLK